MTYSVCFAFLSFEQEDIFTWALEMLFGLLSTKLNMPKVVVTDMDNASMNVVAKVLLETDVILCYFHIGKNIKAKCNQIVESKRSLRMQKLLRKK